jgi:hypothetical protein
VLLLTMLNYKARIPTEPALNRVAARLSSA